MILWRRAVDWRRDQCLLRVEIQSAIGLNDIAKTLKLVENSMKASSMHWFMAHRGELRKFGIWPNRDQPPRSFVIRGEVSEEERRWLEGLGWDDVQEGRRHLLSLPDHKEVVQAGFIGLNSIRILNAMYIGLFESNGGSLALEWNGIQDWLCNKAWPEYTDELIRQAVLVCCRIGVNLRNWANGRFTPSLAASEGETMLILLEN